MGSLALGPGITKTLARLPCGKISHLAHLTARAVAGASLEGFGYFQDKATGLVQLYFFGAYDGERGAAEIFRVFPECYNLFYGRSQDVLHNTSGVSWALTNVMSVIVVFF